MLKSGSLRSKVAQRIFAVFLICALLPFSGLVLLAYNQVIGFFETRNEAQLRDLAKLFGLDVHEKLTLLDASLQVLAASMRISGRLPDKESLGKMAGGHKDRWLRLFVEPAALRRDASRELGLEEFTALAQKQLAIGKAVISVIPSSHVTPARIFLSLAVDPGQSHLGVLTGEVDLSYLWGFTGTRLLLSHIQPCVLNREGVILMCSEGQSGNLDLNVKINFFESTIGNFELSENGRHFLVSYWTVPMRYEFQVPGWVVLLKASKEGAFASISELQSTFILSVVVSVGLSLLLAIYQIRKRLVPVEKLQEGTRRIAENDFAFKIETQSYDEFDELAASMNTMAEQLGRQFKTITTTGEIDRAVLSLLDSSKIIETILSRISQALDCDLGVLTLFSSANGQTQQWQLHWQQGFTHFNLSNQFWPAEATRDKDPLAYAVSEAKTAIAVSDPAIFHPIGESVTPSDGLNAGLGAPLMVKDDVLGVLSFYAQQNRKFTTDEIEFVRRLSNQVAVALYNSQLYEQTINQAAELLKANQAKDEFLSVMSHELRTPLNVIMGYVRLLKENILGELTAEQSHAVNTLDKQSNELLTLINAVMEATLLQTDAVVVERQLIDPAEFIDSLRSQITIAPEKGFDLVWHAGAALPTLISDRTKLERIITIFIDNAVKFTIQGSISVSAELAAEPGAIEFRVADTGIGIPEEFKQSIFEVFRQVDNSGTREFGGLGLGLFIAKQLADRLGAEIRVQSEVGQGSVFTLKVPLGGNLNDTTATKDVAQHIGIDARGTM